MSKKKHPEHVNHERWLVSYADFITLLFAFFVVLFASGQSDKAKKAQLAKAMQTAFDSNGIFDAHSKTPPISPEATEANNATPLPLALPVPTAQTVEQQKLQSKVELGMQERAQSQIQQVIQTATARKQLGEGAITVHTAPEGVVISLREGGFFASGQAEVLPEALGVFRTLAAALPNQSMRIEGHTDNIPIHTAQFTTNWELSTARAASVTRLLIAEHAVDPSQVSAAGLAEFHPTASNDTAEGRARNRRVDIILLRSAGASASAEAPASAETPTLKAAQGKAETATSGEPQGKPETARQSASQAKSETASQGETKKHTEVPADHPASTGLFVGSFLPPLPPPAAKTAPAATHRPPAGTHISNHAAGTAPSKKQSLQAPSR